MLILTHSWSFGCLVSDYEFRDSDKVNEIKADVISKLNSLFEINSLKDIENTW